MICGHCCARVRSDEDLETYITSVVMEKEEGHRINEADFHPPSRSMVFIGG